MFWGAHERPAFHTTVCPPDSSLPPVSYQFDARLDLFAFISAAADHGLNVILRIGPYVCAEVSYGGFPLRLRDIPGLQFRTFNRPFMQEMERWVRFIAAELHKRTLLAPAGGPVILVQLENEYSMVSDAYGDAGARYLQWCADLQKQLDFGVPAIMCYGAADGVVETINAFYAHDNIAQHRARHPDQPPVWTECWTGWYDVWGAPHHERPVTDLAYAVARFFAEGGAGVNYYMWMGGTNFGRDGMYLQASSYDYDAPIDELYGPTSKSLHLTRLHDVLLTRFEQPFLACVEDAQAVDGVFEWGDVAFICNDGVVTKHVSLPDGRYEADVLARSVQIVDAAGHLLFDSARVLDEHVVTKRYVDCLATCVQQWQCYAQTVPIGDEAAGDTVGEGGIPPEQLRVTADTTDYCWYIAEFERVNKVCSGEIVAEFEAADLASVYVDGVCVGRSATPLWEDRWSNKWNQYKAGEEAGTKQRIILHDGFTGRGERVWVSILTAALGLVKGDWQLGADANMLQERKGLFSDVHIRQSGRAIYERRGEWRARSAKMELDKAVSAESGGELVRGNPAWYECCVAICADKEGFVADLSGYGKGLLWVNQHLIGRFWGIEGTRGRNGFLDGSPIVQRGRSCTQRWYHVPGWAIGGDGTRVNVCVVLYVEDGRRPVGESIKLYRVERSRCGGRVVWRNGRWISVEDVNSISAVAS